MFDGAIAYSTTFYILSIKQVYTHSHIHIIIFDIKVNKICLQAKIKHVIVNYMNMSNNLLSYIFRLFFFICVFFASKLESKQTGNSGVKTIKTNEAKKCIRRNF